MLCRAMAYLKLQVLALEPLPNNAKMRAAGAASRANLNFKRAGLGEVNGTTGHYPIEYDEHKSTLHLQIAPSARTTTRATRPTPS